VLRKKHRTKRRRRKLLLFFIITSSLALVSAIFVLIIFISTEVPSIENFEKREVAQSTKIYDQTGEVLLWEIHGEERRTTVPFEKITLNIKNATVAIEDSSFYSHGGFSFTSLIRVLFLNFFRGKEIGSGGSTITQQLVKNTLLTNERTISRKIKEVVAAIKLETVYTKDQILNLYLNEIPYGSNAYGVEAASEAYFGKHADELTLAEAAYIAALPKAPTFYSPYGNHKAELTGRKNLVLSRMQELGFITNSEYEQAKNEKVSFAPQKRGGIIAPHFVMYVRELLTEKYGEDIVERGGLKVITSLDVKLQQKAEEIIARKAPELEKNFNAKNLGLVAIDPKTGRILTMVGSRDYFESANDGNFNVTLAPRQPGSAFKPIVYTTAFKRGFTPETVVFDLETNFAVSGKPYIPNNFDNKFRGPISFREALAQSLNVPSVKVLYLAGIKNSIQTAEEFGISTLTDPNRYGLTLVLGGGEVKLLELTSAYGVFANRGIRTDHHAIIEVRDKNNTILEEENITSRRVIDEIIADNINSVLSDNKARTPMFGARSPLFFEDGSVAVKTGTTNNYRDAWAIGYNQKLTAGVWTGNNDNTPMTKNIAGYIIAGTWREFMDSAIPLFQSDPFPQPAKLNVKKPVLRGIWKGSRSYIIDKTSGKLATEFTPPSQQEERVPREIHSILYWLDKDNPDGQIPEHPELDPQFQGWEGPVRAWAQKMNLLDEITLVDTIGKDSTHSPENWPKINLDATLGDLSFTQQEDLVFYPKITGTYPIAEVDIFIDDEFVKSERGNISRITITQQSVALSEGTHTLALKAYDSIGNRQQQIFQFTIAGP